MYRMSDAKMEKLVDVEITFGDNDGAGMMVSVQQSTQFFYLSESKK